MKGKQRRNGAGKKYKTKKCAGSNKKRQINLRNKTLRKIKNNRKRGGLKPYINPGAGEEKPEIVETIKTNVNNYFKDNEIDDASKLKKKFIEDIRDNKNNLGANLNAYKYLVIYPDGAIYIKLQDLLNYIAGVSNTSIDYANIYDFLEEKLDREIKLTEKSIEKYFDNTNLNSIQQKYAGLKNRIMRVTTAYETAGGILEQGDEDDFITPEKAAIMTYIQQIFAKFEELKKLYKNYIYIEALNTNTNKLKLKVDDNRGDDKLSAVNLQMLLAYLQDNNLSEDLNTYYAEQQELYLESWNNYSSQFLHWIEPFDKARYDRQQYITLDYVNSVLNQDIGERKTALDKAKAAKARLPPAPAAVPAPVPLAAPVVPAPVPAPVPLAAPLAPAPIPASAAAESQYINPLFNTPVESSSSEFVNPAFNPGESEGLAPLKNIISKPIIKPASEVMHINPAFNPEGLAPLKDIISRPNIQPEVLRSQETEPLLSEEEQKQKDSLSKQIRNKIRNFLVSLKPKHEEIMQVTAPSVQQAPAVQQAPGAEQIELKNLNEEEEENQIVQQAKEIIATELNKPELIVVAADKRPDDKTMWEFTDDWKNFYFDREDAQIKVSNEEEDIFSLYDDYKLYYRTYLNPSLSYRENMTEEEQEEYMNSMVIDETSATFINGFNNFDDAFFINKLADITIDNYQDFFELYEIYLQEIIPIKSDLICIHLVDEEYRKCTENALTKLKLELDSMYQLRYFLDVTIKLFDSQLEYQQNRVRCREEGKDDEPIASLNYSKPIFSGKEIVIEKYDYETSNYNAYTYDYNTLYYVLYNIFFQKNQFTSKTGIDFNNTDLKPNFILEGEEGEEGEYAFANGFNNFNNKYLIELIEQIEGDDLTIDFNADELLNSLNPGKVKLMLRYIRCSSILQDADIKRMKTQLNNGIEVNENEYCNNYFIKQREHYKDILRTYGSNLNNNNKGEGEPKGVTVYNRYFANPLLKDLFLYSGDYGLTNKLFGNDDDLARSLAKFKPVIMEEDKQPFFAKLGNILSSLIKKSDNYDKNQDKLNVKPKWYIDSEYIRILHKLPDKYGSENYKKNLFIFYSNFLVKEFDNLIALQVTSDDYLEKGLNNFNNDYFLNKLNALLELKDDYKNDFNEPQKLDEINDFFSRFIPLYNKFVKQYDIYITMIIPLKIELICQDEKSWWGKKLGRKYEECINQYKQEYAKSRELLDEVIQDYKLWIDTLSTKGDFAEQIGEIITVEVQKAEVKEKAEKAEVKEMSSDDKFKQSVLDIAIENINKSKPVPVLLPTPAVVSEASAEDEEPVEEEPNAEVTNVEAAVLAEAKKIIMAQPPILPPSALPISVQVPAASEQVVSVPSDELMRKAIDIAKKIQQSAPGAVVQPNALLQPGAVVQPMPGAVVEPGSVVEPSAVVPPGAVLPANDELMRKAIEIAKTLPRGPVIQVPVQPGQRPVQQEQRQVQQGQRQVQQGQRQVQQEQRPVQQEQRQVLEGQRQVQQGQRQVQQGQRPVQVRPVRQALLQIPVLQRQRPFLIRGQQQPQLLQGQNIMPMPGQIPVQYPNMSNADNELIGRTIEILGGPPYVQQPYAQQPYAQQPYSQQSRYVVEPSAPPLPYAPQQQQQVSVQQAPPPETNFKYKIKQPSNLAVPIPPITYNVVYQPQADGSAEAVTNMSIPNPPYLLSVFGTPGYSADRTLEIMMPPSPQEQQQQQPYSA